MYDVEIEFLLAHGESCLRLWVTNLMGLVENDAFENYGKELDRFRLRNSIIVGSHHVVQFDLLRLGQNALHFAHDGAVCCDDQVVLGQAEKNMVTKFFDGLELIIAWLRVFG